MTGWQPIDTAPTDGTWVLLKGGSIDDGWYDWPFPPAVVAQYDAPFWYFAWYDGGGYGKYENPTHWMPIPGEESK